MWFDGAFDVAQIAVVDVWLTKKKTNFAWLLYHDLFYKLPEYAFFIRFKRFASPNLLPLVISAPLFWFKRANSKTIRWYFFDRDFFHESLLFDSMRLDPKWKIAQSCQYFQRNFFFTKKFNFNDNNGTKRILSLLVLLLLLQWIRYFWFILLKD